MTQASWFGGRLKELREAAGLTQEQLAGKAGLTKDGLARIERGNRSPNWETVVALCVSLGVRCDAFMQPPSERPAAGPGRPPKEKPAAPAPRPTIQPGRTVQEASAAAAKADKLAGGRGRSKKSPG